MGFLSDIKVLYHLALKPVRGKDHAARMESFYSGQAEAYDDFRKRLLKGREELYGSIDPPTGGTWVDMGGGTGSNLEYFADCLPQLKTVYVVDLAGSLLKMAQKRAEANNWSNVTTVETDATTWQPSEPADVVTFSYSLTMIPDWFAAIDNAWRMLKPGGILGVVDFYVARKFPGENHKKHGWFTRTFWPTWFNMDNVFPSPDHVPYLHRHFTPLRLEESRGRVPYMPLTMPYYIFVGKKREE